MTIQAAASEKAYAGDGVSTVFAIPFPFDTAADLKLTSTDASGNIATIGTGFTVSGGGGSTGNATFSVAPISGVTITIYDNPAQTQPTNYVSLDAFPAESHEKALDRVTRLAKRLSQQLGRTVRAPDGDVFGFAELPPAARRANLGLVFDSNGNPTVGNLTPPAFNGSQSFTATAGQTVFILSVAATISSIILVSLDGAVLVPGVDYTASGKTITLNTGALVGQTLYVAASIAVFNTNQITAAEIAAGVTQANFSYVEGDLRRYGGVGNGAADDSAAWQQAINVGIARIPKGYSFKIVTPATKTGQVTILGEGKSSKLLCDGTVLTVTTGTNSVIDNFWMENITAPWIITRNTANWAAVITGTLVQSNANGYQPTSNDTDIWSTLTAPQQNQQIGPVIQFTGAASGIQVSRIYGRFVRISVRDATESCVQDCNFRGGKGQWGAIEFDNWTNGIQRGAHNRAINNRVSYPSFCGVFFSSNDDFTIKGNVCYLGGESGTKTTQTLGITFTASVGGAVAGTLTAAVTNGVYTVAFSDNEVRSVTVTGGTAATWAGALGATSILTASAWQSTLNPQCFRGQIVDNHCYQMYYDGLDCDSTYPGTNDSASTFHQVHNNYAYNNGHNGFNADGQYNSYIGNRIIQNFNYGLWGITSFSVIADNVCYDNNTARGASNHDIQIGGPNQNGCYVYGNYVWAGGTQNNFGIYAPGQNKIGDNYGVGSNFFFGNAGQITSVVQNYNDLSTGSLTDQSFSITIRNNGGVIQHRVVNDFSAAAAGNYSSRINNASSAFTNTPTGADGSTAFAAGGKILSAATSQFMFDTAAQVSANDQMIAVLEGNSTGTALNVSCAIGTVNVNGVSRSRLLIQFNNAATDAAFNLTTLAAGQYVNVRFYGKIA